MKLKKMVSVIDAKEILVEVKDLTVNQLDIDLDSKIWGKKVKVVKIKNSVATLVM